MTHSNQALITDEIWNRKWNTRLALRIQDFQLAARDGSLDAASREEELLQLQFPVHDCPAPQGRFERLPNGDYPPRAGEVGILLNGIITAEGCDDRSDPVRVRIVDAQ